MPCPVLLFLVEEAEASPATATTSSEGNLITRSTVRLRREDAIYLRPGKLLTEARAIDRVTRDLNALLRISRS